MYVLTRICSNHCQNITVYCSCISAGYSGNYLINFCCSSTSILIILYCCSTNQQSKEHQGIYMSSRFQCYQEGLEHHRVLNIAHVITLQLATWYRLLSIIIAHHKCLLHIKHTVYTLQDSSLYIYILHTCYCILHHSTTNKAQNAFQDH